MKVLFQTSRTHMFISVGKNASRQSQMP